MKVQVEPGKYIVAVSGGVDSMVLLDVLAKQPELELVVAHFDHGIRTDSHLDRPVVAAAAKRYGLPFESQRAELGPGASEARAREIRYAFLRDIKERHEAKAIITAHHQDDLLETAVLNLLRGTGRKGLSSLRSTKELRRPLLDTPKAAIREYARAHHIQWREDATNSDERYLRNYIRRRILRRLSSADRQMLWWAIKKTAAANKQIDALLHSLLSVQTAAKMLPRRWFTLLPHRIATEVMAQWLRQNGVREFDHALIERLVVSAKVLAPGKVKDVNAGVLLKVTESKLQLVARPTHKSK